MLATHDSLSSYPVKYWILKPFNFMAKCQTKNLYDQYIAGARSFDLRFAWYRNKWYAAHGAQIFNITLGEVLDTMIDLSSDLPIYFRAIAEDTFYKKSNHTKLYSDIVGYINGKKHQMIEPIYVCVLLVCMSWKRAVTKLISSVVMKVQGYPDYWAYLCQQ